MALFGVNFSIYFFLLRRKFDLAWKNAELRWYVSIILGSTLLITCNIMKLYGGESAETTRITWHDGAAEILSDGKKRGTFRTATLLINARDCAHPASKNNGII